MGRCMKKVEKHWPSPSKHSTLGFSFTGCLQLAAEKSRFLRETIGKEEPKFIFAFYCVPEGEKLGKGCVCYSVLMPPMRKCFKSSPTKTRQLLPHP